MEFRTIVHVDMDAFFTSVEVRDFPHLKDKPVVVGADPKNGVARGVVSAASYEARKFGVKSAQPISTAYKLCPEAIFMPHRFSRYVEVSNEVMDVLAAFSETHLRMSIDEAVLDCTASGEKFKTWKKLGLAIKQAVREKTSLSCTIGIATGRTLAKMATEINKPDGLTLVHPGKEREFLAPLAVEAIPGIGPKAKQSLNRLGFRKIADLQQVELPLLTQALGRWGERIYDFVNGRDEDEIILEHERKSFGEERTFETDLSDSAEALAALKAIAEELATQMRRKNISGRTVTVKIRFADFRTITRSQTYPMPIRSAPILEEVALQIFSRNVNAGTVSTEKIRLLGIQLSHLYTAQVGEQLWLF
ncbi:MAG: DNA polymerase IV [Spirochaetes bacterium]|nr:DNA polymerase IV [Spirochaetota bacterium]